MDLDDVRGRWNALNNMFDVKSGIFTFINDDGNSFIKKEGLKYDFERTLRKLDSLKERTHIKDTS